MSKAVSRFLVAVSTVLVFAAVPSYAWNLPEDKGTLGKNEIAEIIAGNDYPETTTYTQRIEFIDFTSYGKKFTQVVVRLDPKKPRLRNGKKLVVVGAEPGSEYAMDFLQTVEGKDGMGVWLAKRGFIFIGLTRVGRWNFLAKDGSGSWKDIPIGERMPIFNRDQKANWSPDDYTVQKITGADTAASSDVNRYAKPGTELYNQMLAATPVTMLIGYQKAINRVLSAAERKKSLMLYWGMSTGGAFLWPLAKYVKPDGYMGWGSCSPGIAYFYSSGAKMNNYNWPYDKATVRVRERGVNDFNFYTKHVPQETKDAWYQNALKDPRFKSVEDPMMLWSPAALTEIASRLWMADFLPEEYRKVGFVKFLQDIFEPSLPRKEWKDIPALEMNGTLDEVLPPRDVDARREFMEPYCGKYRVARVEDYHHYLFTQDMNKVVGTLWLKFIDSGYFDRGKK